MLEAEKIGIKRDTYIREYVKTHKIVKFQDVKEYLPRPLRKGFTNEVFKEILGSNGLASLIIQ